MAITIISSPQLIMPVYTPFYYVATSTNVNQPNFQFIVDVFNCQTATTPFSQFLINPRPDANGTLQFSPARILESYLSYEIDYNNNYSLPPDLTGGTVATNSALLYWLRFGESYGASGAIVQYTGLTNASGYTFNGVLPYEKLPYWKSSGYTYSGKTFLTNMPNPMLINSTDVATISFFNNLSANTATYIQLTTYQNSGGTVQYNLNNLAYSSNTWTYAPNIINHFGTGISNLNNSNSLVLGGGITIPLVNINTDYQYSIQLCYSSFGTLYPLSQIQFYIINNRCSKYQPVRLMWKNQLGGWDYFSFNLVSRSYVNSTKSTFKKILPYNYKSGMRGTTVLNQTNQQTSLVNTDWINDSQMNWLVTDLFVSAEVYELSSTGVILPIILTDTNIENQKQINDKLFQKSFAYEYAYELNSTRN